MIRQEEVYKIGRIGKPHGVKGELVFSFDDDVFDRTDADSLILSIDGILVPFFIEEYRFRTDDTALLKLEDIDSAEAASELTGCDVYFPRNKDGEDSDTVSKAEIIGYSIYDLSSGKEVGTIDSVDDSTVNVLFSVTTKDGESVLLPASEELMENIDRKNRILTMRLPAGLLDL